MDKIHISSIIAAVSRVSNVLGVFSLCGCVLPTLKTFSTRLRRTAARRGLLGKDQKEQNTEKHRAKKRK